MLFHIQFHGRLRRGLMIACCISPLLLPPRQPAVAQDAGRARQHLSLEVLPIAQLTTSGDPAPLIIDVSPGAFAPRDVEDASSRYSMTTTQKEWEITASIDRPMPKGMHLSLQVETRQGTSSGIVEVSHAVLPVQLANGSRPGVERDARIVYMFSVKSSIDFDLFDSRIVTLTMTESAASAQRVVFGVHVRRPLAQDTSRTDRRYQGSRSGIEKNDVRPGEEIRTEEEKEHESAEGKE